MDYPGHTYQPKNYVYDSWKVLWSSNWLRNYSPLPYEKSNFIITCFKPQQSVSETYIHHTRSHQGLVKGLGPHLPFPPQFTLRIYPTLLQALVLTRFIHRRFPSSNIFTYQIPDSNPSFIDSTSQMNVEKTTVSSCCLDGEFNIKVKAISLCARGVARPWDMSLWSCDLTSPQNCNYHVTYSSVGRNRLGSWDYFWKQSPSC